MPNEELKTMNLTHEGLPVRIEKRGNRLIISRLENCAYDSDKKVIVGGTWNLLLQLDVAN